MPETENKTTKLDELKARQHRHDVTIKTSAETRVISSKEWHGILTNEGANEKPPEFTRTGAISVSSYIAAAEGEKLTRQYRTNRASHFGFGFRTISDISKIEEMFKAIDKLTFVAATNGECEAINMEALPQGLVGNDAEEVSVDVETLERLNWMFSRVQFLCGDMLGTGFVMPKFYSVSAEKNGIVLGHWLVTAKYVNEVFGTVDDNITISDDGMVIRFSTAVPTTGEICSEDDEFCLTSFYDAIKNLVTDMRYEET